MSKVPEGWERLSIREVTSLITKGATPTTYGYDFIEESSDSVIFIGAYNCSFSGTFKSNSNKWICQDANLVLKRSMLKADDTIFCIVGNTIGSSFKVSEEIIPANINQNVALIRPSSGFVDSDYLHYWMRSSYIQMQVGIEASVQAQPSLSLKQIGEFGINLPPLPEQTKIAQILSTWDKAIATTEKLIGNSQQHKNVLVQQIITGKRRLFGFSSKWAYKKIGDFIVESRITGTTGDIAKKITIKLYGKGVISKVEKRLGSESTKYYSRKSGQFIYSKLDFLNGAFGIIPAELDGYESTLDLPAFDFKEGVCPAWFLYFVAREQFYSNNLGLANGGRKARRVNPSDLINITIKAPPFKEQQKIAAVLTAADNEIDLLQKKLAFLKQEKAALMQQLLTGKRRVKVEAA